LVQWYLLSSVFSLTDVTKVSFIDILR